MDPTVTKSNVAFHVIDFMLFLGFLFLKKGQIYAHASEIVIIDIFILQFFIFL
jgi:hypothetical protein